MAEETYSTDGAECPYCGHVNKAIDSDGGLYDESIDEWDCDNCGKPFIVSVNVRFSWSATPYDDVAQSK